MRVLVVDDDRDMEELYRLEGAHAGIDVEVKQSALDALKYLGDIEYAVDIGILDLSMPNFDGLSLSDEIRRNETLYPPRRMELAFFTGVTLNDSIKRVQERNNVKKIFQKPYDVQKLFAEIKTWVNCETMPEEIILSQNERGSAPSNWLIALVALILQIVVASLFMWLLNRQDVAAAYQFTLMKSDRDQIKRICDSNALLDYQKEKWIEQNKLELPAQMSGQTPCQTTGDK